MRRTHLKNRFPTIIAELDPRVGRALRGAAELVVVGAKSRVPVNTGALRGAIHVEREADGGYQVVAGDNDAWYGHLVEFGTTHTPEGEKRRHDLALTDEQRATRAVRGAARPFLVPAAEDVRQVLPKLVTFELRRL